MHGSKSMPSKLKIGYANAAINRYFLYVQLDKCHLTECVSQTQMRMANFFMSCTLRNTRWESEYIGTFSVNCIHVDRWKLLRVRDGNDPIKTYQWNTWETVSGLSRTRRYTKTRWTSNGSNRPPSVTRRNHRGAFDRKPERRSIVWTANVAHGCDPCTRTVGSFIERL